MDILSKTFDLTGKTIIVTGGSKGLGKTMALALAEAGADVVVASRTLSELEKTAREIRDLKRESLAIKADITSEVQVRSMVEETIEKFGKIDVLVNNAGTGRIDKPPEKTNLKEWSEVMETNVTGTFICSKEVASKMIARKKGKIINLASMSGFIINRYVHGGAYDCSKLAIVALTKALAVEWAPYKITVNAIAPGYFRTEPNEIFFQRYPDFYQKVIDMTPLRRIGNPQELSGLIIYLASEASNFMTGSTILIDGGYTLW